MLGRAALRTIVPWCAIPVARTTWKGGDLSTQIEVGLSEMTVADVMHPGVLTCRPATTLRGVARMMARYHVHAVVVSTEESEADEALGFWGLVSDRDLVAAAAHGDVDGRTAGGTAQTPIVTLNPHEPVGHAAELMEEHGVSHLLVVSSGSERPVGIVSSLDIARSLASQPTFTR
jgi:CBS domain-containing protein